jgi:hypothetical protein
MSSILNCRCVSNFTLNCFQFIIETLTYLSLIFIMNDDFKMTDLILWNWKRVSIKKDEFNGKKIQMSSMNYIRVFSGSPSEGRVTNVEIVGCAAGSTCILKRGTNSTVHIQFVNSTYELRAYWTILPSEVRQYF